jgi:hypothetical protein
VPKPWVMSPIPDLAQQLVARMDSVLADLDDLGPGAADGSPPLAPVELRQVGGLTAGGSLPLRPGRHEFGPADQPGTRLEAGEIRAIAFRLAVEASGEVRIEPGTLPVRVDGRRLSRPEPLGEAIIDVPGAAFTVARTRTVGRRRTPQVPALPDAEPVRGPLHLAARPPAPPDGPFHQVARWRHRHALEAIAEDLGRSLARAAAAEARHRRTRHADPEELVHRARTGTDLWACAPGQPGFGLVPVALGHVPWRPPLHVAGELEPRLAEVVRTWSSLPLTPLQVDLCAGPLAVVGPRAATVAVVRHLVLGLLVFSGPQHLDLGLLTTAATDWSWLELAPRDRRPRPNARELVIVDADRATGELACRQTLGAAGRLGAVIVVEDPTEVPTDCVSVLEVRPDGSATLTGSRTGLLADDLLALGLPEATTAAALRSLAERHRTADPTDQMLETAAGRP